jgi:hypothetical protein
MTANRFIKGISGDTDVAATLSIAASRCIYAVTYGPKLKKNPKELLPAMPAGYGWGIRLTKSEDRKTDDIINRPGRSTYLEEKSVLTSGATPDVLLEDVGNFVQGERDRSDQTHVDFVKSPFLSKP